VTVKLSVLMPVYNEARTLRTIVGKVLASPVGIDIELVCVDDCSRDKSAEVLEELAAQDSRIRVVHHPVNRGKGAAIRTAIAHMTGDIAIVQDSDLEYDPAEYPQVIQPILDGRADAVFGSRFAAAPTRRVSFYWHALGNKALTWLTNVLNDLDLTDMETCYKAVRADLLRSLRLTSDRFGIEPEITTRLAQWGARIYEVPISYHGRSYAEGKNIGWRDGLQAIWLIVKFRYLDTRFTDDAAYRRLRVLSRARRVNQWRFDPFAGHVGERILEVGSGLGAVTQQLLRKERVVCLEPNPTYALLLRRRFGHLENVRIEQGDLTDLGRTVHDLEISPVDTVVSYNALECLDDDTQAVEAMLGALQPGGRLLLLVSAHERLLGEVDRRLGRVRRYEPDHLRDLLRKVGFQAVDVREFNRLGALAWRLGRLSRGSEPTGGQVRLFSLLLPIAKALEKVEALPGLNLLAVAEKPAAPSR
jgi:glycosyltransferase involved in cell wall biosynthesis